MIYRLSDYWQQRNSRERLLLSILGLLLIVLIFYSLCWQPLQQAIAQQNRQIEQHRYHLMLLKHSPQRQNKNSKQSVEQILRSSAAQQAITIQNTTSPDGNKSSVTVETLPFTQLLSWLWLLEKEHGIQVITLELQAAAQTGWVNVRTLRLERL